MQPMIVNQELQDAADSAYMRVIWWECFKMALEHVSLVKEHNLSAADSADYAIEQFKTRCESGFFDVKRQTGKGE